MNTIHGWLNILNTYIYDSNSITVDENINSDSLNTEAMDINTDLDSDSTASLVQSNTLDNRSMLPNVPQGKIKHLVISGGATWGLSAYGVVRECHRQGFLNINDLETIYGTSIGSLLAVFFALKYDFEVLDNYIVKRPWQHVWNANVYSIMEMIDKCGIYQYKHIEEIFRPLFLALDLTVDITMKEFYEHTHVDLHIFLTEINDFKCIDVSHTTHPDWKLIEVVYGSCTVPFIFAPLRRHEKCYIDGGFFANYPLDMAIKQLRISNPDIEDEILGIELGVFTEEEYQKTHISETTKIFDYATTILNKLLRKILFSNTHTKTKYEIFVHSSFMTVNDIILAVSSEEHRRKMINFGTDEAYKYFESVFI
jgi:predicted acylesterase/phospholipase RssA